LGLQRISLCFNLRHTLFSMTEQVSNTVHDTSSTFFDVRRVKIGRRPNTAVERLVYSTLIAIFDTLDVVLCWARPFDKKLEDRVRKIYSRPSFVLIPCLT